MIHVPAAVEKNTKNVAVVRQPFVVPGFRAAAAGCAMRYRNRDDLALITADSGATAAGVFTQNCFCAAPVLLCRQSIRRSAPDIRAIVVNAGIANACTGKEGLEKAHKMATETAKHLGVSPEQVLVASTGVIGAQIDLEPFIESLPKLAGNLRQNGWHAAAQAIMTTDTVAKLAFTQVQLSGKTVTIGGIAKGSGMIAPQMATMLAFVCTDAAVSPEVLQTWLSRGAERSFNRITIDGDTSTNDTVIVLANGFADNKPITHLDHPDSLRFGKTLEAVLVDLAKQIVADGEGATKLVKIMVSGASDPESARQIAFTIAQSPLVKTALFGEDPNWGRVVAAAGRAGVPLQPEKVSLWFGDVMVFAKGVPLLTPEVEERASAVCRKKEIELRLDLGTGLSEFEVYTCDFSYDYVKINADYRS